LDAQGEVAHRYGSKGNVSVDPEVGLKLMEQVQDHLDNSSNSPTDRSPLPQIAQRLWATRPEDATRLPPAVELGRTDAYCRGSEAAGNKPF